MQVALLRPGDDLVDIGADFLSAGLDGLDAVVEEQRLHQTTLHGLGMGKVGAQLAALVVMPHGRFLLLLQIEVHGNELVLHFLNGLRTKVPDVQQVVLGELDQLAHRMDAGTLQAVVRADGQVQILDLLVQLGVRLLTLRSEDGRHFALFLFGGAGQAEERAHVLVDDVGSTGDRHR